MSSFSKVLLDYLTEKGITVAKLAAECGVERTTMFKYVHGKRNLTDRHLAVMIAEKLRMSVTKREELLQSFERTILGEDTYQAYEIIREMIQDLDRNIPESDQYSGIKTVIQKKHEGVIKLNGRNQIAEQIKYCLAIAEELNEMVYVIMQPQYETAEYIIQSSLIKSNIHVEHIVCLNYAQETGKQENLRILRRLLPLCFYDNYQMLYYYGEVGEHITKMTTFPNVMLVGDYVLHFDFNMQLGMLNNSKEYAQICLQDFNKKKSYCTRIGTRLYTAMEQLEFSKNIHNGARDFNWSIHATPCLGLCISQDVLSEVIYEAVPQREELIQGLLQLFGNWEGETYSATSVKIVSIFNRRGLQNFLDTGRLQDYPDQFYRPISPKWRKKFLERMLQLAKQGVIRYFLVKDDQLHIPDQIILEVDEERGVEFVDFSGEEMMNFDIEEASIRTLFVGFGKYIIESDIVYSEEETLGYIRQVWDAYEA